MSQREPLSGACSGSASGSIWIRSAHAKAFVAKRRINAASNASSKPGRMGRPSIRVATHSPYARKNPAPVTSDVEAIRRRNRRSGPFSRLATPSVPIWIRTAVIGRHQKMRKTVMKAKFTVSPPEAPLMWRT